MKVISIRQPYATLIALGAKRYHLMSSGMRIGTLLAIHASQTNQRLWKASIEPFRANLRKAYPNVNDIPRGAVICVCEVISWQPVTPELIANLAAPEIAFDDWRPGRVAIRLHVYHVCNPPIPCKGDLGVFDRQLPELYKVREAWRKERGSAEDFSQEEKRTETTDEAF